jgi:hypothetical protein
MGTLRTIRRTKSPHIDPQPGLEHDGIGEDNYCKSLLLQ